ncbi:MAG: methionyl-tRNA formyltransferase [Actinobacteria bacterium]|nr:methionyl-tRNA formyltransferase [Actinomycetota bacterium]
MRAAWVSFDVIGRDCLEASAQAGAEIVAVVTLPGPLDPNRAGQCSFAAVAGRHGARLIETGDVNDPAAIAALREERPELVFVVGWSQLLRGELLSLAPAGVFGMHPTLLPRHRGRAPIPWALLSGLARTGVTLFEILDETADSGAIVGQVAVPIEPDETATTLYAKLSRAHVELIAEHVPRLIDGTAARLPQDPRRASAWPRRTPADGIIDWDTRAPYLYDWVRAQTRPYPGAFTYLGDEKLVVWSARAVEGSGPAGTVVEERPEGAVVACGEGALLLEEVEPAAVLAVGSRLG